MVSIYVHITGCFFFYVIESNKKFNWIPPFDYIDGSKSVFYFKEDKVTPQSWTYQYGCCLYYMMLVIGGNEIGPTDLNELIWVAMMNIFGLILKVVLFGELSSLIAVLSSSAVRQQKVIDTANIAMANLKMSNEYRYKVRQFFKKTQDTQDK
jgi:hypothetical protein